MMTLLLMEERSVKPKVGIVLRKHEKLPLTTRKVHRKNSDSYVPPEISDEINHPEFHVDPVIV